MVAVTVVSAASGEEILTMELGEEWHVSELKAIIFAKDGTCPELQTLLLKDQILSDGQRFYELGEGPLELQLLRRRWTITVRDVREASGCTDGVHGVTRNGPYGYMDYRLGAGGYKEDAEVWYVESYPGCTDGDFLWKVAEKIGLPPRTLPRLIAANRWRVSDAGGYDLASYELQSGSEVRLTNTYQAPLVSVGTSPPKSRRSEFLESNSALGLLDECQRATLLLDIEDLEVAGEVKTILTGAAKGCGCAAQLPQVLTDTECRNIESAAKSLAFVPQELSCQQGTRRYNRVVVQDERLSELLWTRMRPFLEEALAAESKRPLGFGCAQGEWELAGLNSCFRINSYGPEGFLKPHRDAAFSPGHSQRSFCTLLIPLTSAGRTRFYQPKAPLDFRGMSLSEELDARGGLHKGFWPTDAVLSAGCPLVFGQALLHEGLPDQNGQKAVLRTDVMVRRPSLPRVLLTSDERRDHMQALRWFREAQQNELRGKPSNDFYEKALSYRYFHPSGPHVDSESEPELRKWTAQEAAPLTPNPLLERHGFQMPELAYLKGPVAAFRLKGEGDAASGSTSTGHLRVAAMYALHLLGHKAYEEWDGAQYTVDFDPSTQKVAAVPLPQLLKDVFESKPCYGAIYNVASRTGDAEQDFHKAVDRAHLVLQHGSLPCSSSVDLLAGMRSTGFVEDADDGADLQGEGVESYRLPDFNQAVREAYCHDAKKQRDTREVQPDWSRYLSALLSAGAPGLDVVSIAKGEETYLPRRFVYHCECGECDTEPPNDKVSPSMQPLNHLVFDFGKHELLVEAQSAVQPSSGLHDLHLLWAELLSQRQSFQPDAEPMIMTLPLEDGQLTLFKDSPCTVAAFDSKGELQTGLPEESFLPGSSMLNWPVCDSQAMQEFLSGSTTEFFPWYTISLRGLNASFHHAGEMNGCHSSTTLDVQVEHAGLAESEHTTTVLAAVTADGEDTLIWTIYHGLSAL